MPGASRRVRGPDLLGSIQASQARIEGQRGSEAGAARSKAPFVTRSQLALHHFRELSR